MQIKGYTVTIVTNSAIKVTKVLSEVTFTETIYSHAFNISIEGILTSMYSDQSQHTFFPK